MAQSILSCLVCHKNLTAIRRHIIKSSHQHQFCSECSSFHLRISQGKSKIPTQKLCLQNCKNQSASNFDSKSNTWCRFCKYQKLVNLGFLFVASAKPISSPLRPIPIHRIQNLKRKKSTLTDFHSPIKQRKITAFFAKTSKITTFCKTLKVKKLDLDSKQASLPKLVKFKDQEIESSHMYSPAF